MVGHYLLFNRTCEEAIRLYEKAFNIKAETIQKYKDMPPNPDFPIAEADMNLVLHSKLVIDGADIMCADTNDEITASDNMYVSITTKDEAFARNAWETLKTDGTVYMELNPEFFAKLHGSLQDKFGVNWMFTVE